MGDLTLEQLNIAQAATELRAQVQPDSTFDRNYVLRVVGPGLVVNQKFVDGIQGSGVGVGAGLVGHGHNGIWGTSHSTDGSGVVGVGGAAGIRGENPNAVGVCGTSDQKVG